MIRIYCDGACSGNGQEGAHGSWAFIIKADPGTYQQSGRLEGVQTNNRAELTAAISALKVATAMGLMSDQVTVCTDSKYVVQGMREWINRWRTTGWKTRDNQPVKNKDLWQELDELVIGQMVSFTWVDDTNPLIAECDRMAKSLV